jgi:hypothetical protein
MIVRRLAVAAVAAVAVAGAVSACAPTSTGRTGGPSSQPSSTQSAAGKPAEAKPADAPAKDSRVRKIGQAFIYTDKLSVQLVSVTRWKPTSAAHPELPHLLATAQITNGSSKIVDLTLGSMELRTGADGAPADVANDYSGGVNGFSGSVAPGRTVTVKYGFEVPANANLNAVSVEIGPGAFEYERIIFEGSAK